MVDAKGSGVAAVYRGAAGTQKANALLIAVAPDLLSELEALVRYAQGGGIPPKHALDRARAATAKATGKDA